MKTTRINIIIVAMMALMLVFAAPIFAKQQTSKKPPTLDKRVQTMTKHLSLTSEQVTKIRPILETQEKEAQSILQVNKDSRAARKKEIKARAATERQLNHDADEVNRETMKTANAAKEAVFEKEMAMVLTPEQNKKFLDERLKK